MSSYYRYPGAKPFSPEESSIFFGREKEIDLLFQRVQRDPLLVLYAKSGLGKSSLLNAGLIPKVQQKQAYLPISLRFGAFESELGKPPLDSAREVLQEQSSLLDRIYQEEIPSLWYLLKAQQLANPGSKGALLIFDQFEELFTYPKSEIENFALQLSELLYSHIPDRFRKGIEKALKEKKDRISAEELKLLHQPYQLRVVLAIRSDRLALIDRLKPFLPDILDNTYELSALSVPQAEDAILNPAYENNGFQSPNFDYEDSAVDHLINFLSEDKKQEIESFQLQILCEHVEQSLVIKKGKTLILRSDLERPQEILEDYYMSKILEIENEGEQLAARKLIEEGLIFEEEERRLNLYEGQIEKSFGVSKSLLNRLVDTHLIRAEPSLRGGYTYELCHDTLVAPVLKAKVERRKEENARQAALNKLEREAELAEEKSKRQKARRLAGFMTFLAIVAIAMSIFAFIQSNKANEAKIDAQKKQEQAEEALSRRNELEIEKTLRDVDQLEEAGQFTMARIKIEEALQEIDSSDIRLLNRLDRLNSR